MRFYLRLDDILLVVVFGTVGYPHESTLLGAASEVANQAKHISYASRTPAENISRHIHVNIHHMNLIGSAACYR